MTNKQYRAAVVGLTGIGARRPPIATGGLRRPMGRSHVSCYVEHPRTELVAVCDIRSEALDEFRETWPELLRRRAVYRLRGAAGQRAAGPRQRRHRRPRACRPDRGRRRVGSARDLLRKTDRHHAGGRGPHDRGLRARRRAVVGRPHPPLGCGVLRRAAPGGLRRAGRGAHRVGRALRPPRDDVPQRHPHGRSALLLLRRGAAVGHREARTRVRPLRPLPGRRRQGPGAGSVRLRADRLRRRHPRDLYRVQDRLQRRDPFRHL